MNSSGADPDSFSHSLSEISLEERKALLWSLVLTAADIPHLLVRRQEGWLLRVSEGAVTEARNEIERFEAENRDWPPRPPKYEHGPGSKHFSPTIVLMGVFPLFYSFTGPWDSGSFWFAAGSISGRLMLEQGEWWRAVTALTLHADSVHLAGNILIGGVFIHFLCRMLGVGLGLSLVLLTGILGNVLNVFFHGGIHNAVGFSTSVFGAAGLLSGTKMRFERSLKEVFLPLGAGIGLLGLLGTGGVRTDLGAHFWGFAIGVGLGIVLGRYPGLIGRKNHPGLQILLFLGCLALVWFCWDFALSSIKKA